MAEIATSASKQNRRRNLPRVDLTPLVDLGFLLITFFVFTATLSNPTTITAILPADSTDSSQVAASGAVNLIADSGFIQYYVGTNPTKAEKIEMKNINRLRLNLISLQQRLIAQEGTDQKLFVMIKPTPNAAFGLVVALLDEMKICGIKRYTLTDMNSTEKNEFLTN